MKLYEVTFKFKFIKNLIAENYRLKKIQKKYAPLNVKNDPNNLNRHWISGVTNIYNELKNY